MDGKWNTTPHLRTQHAHGSRCVNVKGNNSLCKLPSSGSWQSTAVFSSHKPLVLSSSFNCFIILFCIQTLLWLIMDHTSGFPWDQRGYRCPVTKASVTFSAEVVHRGRPYTNLTCIEAGFIDSLPPNLDPSLPPSLDRSLPFQRLLSSGTPSLLRSSSLSVGLTPRRSGKRLKTWRINPPPHSGPCPLMMWLLLTRSTPWGGRVA